MDGKQLAPPRTGVGRYLEGLLDGLAALAPPDLELHVLQPPGRRATLPWVLWSLQRASGRGWDALHLPFYYPPLAPRCPVSVVIHDLLVLERPEWFRPRRLNTLRAMIPAGARRADAVITPSRCVAEAIAGRLGVATTRLRVIPWGLDHARFNRPSEASVEELRRRLRLARPFLLQVGAIEPRRGADLTIAALHAVRARYPDLELVLAGPERAAVAALAAPPPCVRRLGVVAEEDLPALYAAAAAVLAPSRGEGFDFPVLEALACGAVVVASDIDVHVEHFAPAVVLFASGEADALAAAIERALADEELRRRLRAAAPPLVASFTWERSARGHLALWRELAG